MFRNLIIPAPALLAGIVSAILSGLIEMGWLQGILAVPFLPVLPLMVAGFAYGIVGLSSACLVALVITPMLTGLFPGLMVLALKIFPAWLFVRELLKARIDPRRERIVWAPPGAAFTAVALYSAVFVMLIYLVSPGEFAVFLGQLRDAYATMAASMDPEQALALESSGPGLQQALLVLGIWMVVFGLYATACLANFIVLSLRYSLRPSLRFMPYTPKGTVLIAIASAALVALLGNSGSTPGLVDVARIICLLLLLPYFISGLGSIHQSLSHWQNPIVWQAGFYLLVLITLWPALPISLYGLLRQVSRLTNPPR